MGTPRNNHVTGLKLGVEVGVGVGVVFGVGVGVVIGVGVGVGVTLWLLLGLRLGLGPCAANEESCHLTLTCTLAVTFFLIILLP